MWMMYVLAASDSDKRHLLNKFIRKVQQMFKVRILGEPTRFLGMDITYLREQGICCISQTTYIDKFVSSFLWENSFVHSPTMPVEVNVYVRLRLAQSEPDFEGPYRSIVGFTFSLCVH